MFGRPQPATVADVDAAFARNEADVRTLGEAVAARIAIEFQAGRIDRRGVQQRVAFALHQLRSLPAETVPTVMCVRLESVLRETIVEGLKAAGITFTPSEKERT